MTPETSTPAPERTDTIGEAIEKAALGIPVAAIRAWVASDMWNWYVVPLGIASTSAIQMFGIIMLLRVIRHQPTNDDQKDLPPFAKLVQRAIIASVAYICIWVFGYGIYWLMR